MPKPTNFRDAFARALTQIAPRFELLDETGSTNDDARELARDGAPHLCVVVADMQRAGRGRAGRAWEAARGESLLASWIVRPALTVDRWTLLPLLAGLAVADAVRARTKVDAVLKWPNDVLIGERKLGGILVEAEPPAFAVVGVGVNVSQTAFPDHLTATSIALENGLRLDRADLLAAILIGFERALGDPDGALDRYRARCATIGRAVRVTRRSADPIEGIAETIDEHGALVVFGNALAAGEVEHVRSPP